MYKPLESLNLPYNTRLSREEGEKKRKARQGSRKMEEEEELLLGVSVCLSVCLSKQVTQLTSGAFWKRVVMMVVMMIWRSQIQIVFIVRPGGKLVIL